jgi:exopolysaccharide production protein ExoQ
MLLTAKPRTFAALARPGFFENAVLYVAMLGTALLPALSKYQPAQEAPTNSPIAQVFWSILYVAATVRLMDLRHRARPLFAGSIVLCAFVLLMLLSFVWSVAPSTTLLNAIELIGTTVIAYYIVARFTLQEFLTVLSLSFGTIALLSFLLIVIAPGHSRMDWGTGAWSGIYQDKNNLGAAMSLAVLSLVLQLMQPKLKWRLQVVALLAMCTALLIGSNSATAFGDCAGAGVVSLAVLACRSRRFGTIARIVTGIAVGGTLLAVFVFGFTPDMITNSLGRSATLTGRTDFWPYLQQAIADRPIFGYGYNAFFHSFVGSNYLSYYVVQAGGWTPYHAHNSFLQICLDAGFAGAALLVYLILLAFWRSLAFVARNASPLAAWPLAMTLYLVFGSFTETYLGNYNTFEWIFFVAALLYPLKERGRLEA